MSETSPMMTAPRLVNGLIEVTLYPTIDNARWQGPEVIIRQHREKDGAVGDRWEVQWQTAPDADPRAIGITEWAKAMSLGASSLETARNQEVWARKTALERLAWTSATRRATWERKAAGAREPWYLDLERVDASLGGGVAGYACRSCGMKEATVYGPPPACPKCGLCEVKPPSWYWDLGRIGPACDDSDGYECMTCGHREWLRHAPPDECPNCARTCETANG